MTRLLGTLAHFVALLIALPLAAAIVPLGVAAVGLASAQQLMAPAIYRDALQAEGVYDRLPALAAAQLATQIEYGSSQGASEETGGLPVAFRALSAEDWQAILTDVLPADWLRSQTERALDQLLADPPPAGPVLVSLRELKAHLLGGGAMNAYNALVQAQPPCGEADLATWRTGPTSLPRCRPPDEIFAALQPSISAELASVIGGLPDDVDMAGALGGGSADPNEGFDLGQARLLARLGTALPLLPVAVLGLLVVRSRSGVVRWILLPLGVAAALSVLAALVIAPLIDAQVAKAVAEAPAYWSPRLLDAVAGVAHELAVRSAMRTALVGMALGIVVTALVLLARRSVGPRAVRSLAQGHPAADVRAGVP